MDSLSLAASQLQIYLVLVKEPAGEPAKGEPAPAPPPLAVGHLVAVDSVAHFDVAGLYFTKMHTALAFVIFATAIAKSAY